MIDPFDPKLLDKVQPLVDAAMITAAVEALRDAADDWEEQFSFDAQPARWLRDRAAEMERKLANAKP